MNDNPYKTPEAPLVSGTDAGQLQFYVVSLQKFTVLFFSTLGIYTVYWFYKNWELHKQFNNTKSWPIARGIFNIFFTHKLFSTIQEKILSQEKSFDWAPGVLATLYVILTIASNFLDRISMNEIGSPYTDLLSILFLPLTYLTLVKPQKAINFCLNDPQGSVNNSYSVGNYIWIALGSLFWLLAIFGFLVMFNVVNIDGF